MNKTDWIDADYGQSVFALWHSEKQKFLADPQKNLYNMMGASIPVGIVQEILDLAYSEMLIEKDQMCYIRCLECEFGCEDK